MENGEWRGLTLWIEDYELRIGMAPVDEVGQRKGRSSMNHTGVPRGPGGAYCQ